MKDAAYLSMLAQAFRDLHGCEAVHLGSTPVLERFKGKIVWDGEVEIFALAGHPKTQRGFAWSHDPEKKEAVTTVLEIPPVVSPETAVQASIAASFRR